MGAALEHDQFNAQGDVRRSSEHRVAVSTSSRPRACRRAGSEHCDLDGSQLEPRRPRRGHWKLTAGSL